MHKEELAERIRTGQYSLVVRHIRVDEIRETSQIVRDYYGSNDVSEGFVREWNFLHQCPSPSRVMKAVAIRWTEDTRTSRKSVEMILGLTGGAWVNRAFLDSAREQAKRGEFSYLHENSESVMQLPELQSANTPGGEGVNFWLLFFVRANVDIPSLVPFVRQQLFQALEEDVAGWNMNSIHLQVFGERHIAAARSQGFKEYPYEGAITPKVLLTAIQRPIAREDPPSMTDRFFVWKPPIYGLDEDQKSTVLLYLRGYTTGEIATHRLNADKDPKQTSNERKRIYDKIKRVEDAILRVDPYALHDIHVLPLLRQNIWELRPTTPRASCKKSGRR